MTRGGSFFVRLILTWETPVMRRKRIQEEGRQQAQDLLEADTTAQKILQTFEAQWLPDSLELAGHS